MRPISFLVRDGALHPETQEDSAAFHERFGDGEIIETECRPVPSDGQKRFWAMVNAAMKVADIRARWESPEDLGDALKIVVKHRRLSEEIAGKPYWIGESLAKIRNWTDFIGDVRNVLINTLKVPEEALRAPDDPPPHDEIPDRGREPDERQAPRTENEPTAQECFEKFCLIAVSKDFEDKQRHLRTVDTLETQWNEALPELPAFVRKCANNARMVIAGSIKIADMKKLLKDQVPK